MLWKNRKLYWLSCLLRMHFYILHRVRVLSHAIARSSQTRPIERSLKYGSTNFLLERGLATSRERAQALILAGKVLVDGQKIEKAGARVSMLLPKSACSAKISSMSAAADSSWRKLSSTGKSTWPAKSVLMSALPREASPIVCCNTARPVSSQSILATGRSISVCARTLGSSLLEKTNARYLTREQLGEFVDLIVMDVSFISATLVLPAVIAAAFPGSAEERTGRQIVVLVKPQFEAGREHVGKGGIVRDAAVQNAAVEKVRQTV